jgi:hypothetical protein
MGPHQGLNLLSGQSHSRLVKGPVSTIFQEDPLVMPSSSWVIETC